MSTFKLHTQLALSIRRSAQIRDQLQAAHLRLPSKLLLRFRQAYICLRIRKLTEALHVPRAPYTRNSLHDRGPYVA